MKNWSIVKKLFIVTVLFFVIFIYCALYFQSVFFESFYIDRKTESLVQSMEAFTQKYVTSEWTENDVYTNSKAFEQANEVTMGIVDDNLTLFTEEIYEIVIQDNSGEITKVQLSYAVDEEAYYDINLKAGDTIEAVGYKWEFPYENFTPVKISVNGDVWVDNIKDASTLENYDVITGSIIGYSLPSEADLIRGVNSQELVGAIDYWIRANNYNMVLNGTENFVYTDPIDDSSSIVVITPFGDQGSVLFALASLQPLYESIDVLQDYFVYVFAAAIFLSLLLGSIYSVMISKPLIRLDNAAKKMANLDFTHYIEIDSNDEMGSLSNSLNTLSLNLQNSLDELKDANEKLKEDIEKERQIELMRKEFISGISHELKTPLGIIKGFTEGIKDGIAEQRQDMYLDIILDETDKMNDLVLDMLDLSRLELYSYKLELSQFDLVALTLDNFEKFTRQLKEKNLKIQFDSSRENYLIEADLRRIDQVLTNFLSNAIRHSFPGTVIKVNFIFDEHFRMEILNDGKNIPEDKLDKIWDRFYRVDESRSKHDGGSGLGLTIVKNILELHGYPFGAENTDTGLMFFFEIPHSEQ